MHFPVYSFQGQTRFINRYIAIPVLVLCIVDYAKDISRKMTQKMDFVPMWFNRKFCIREFNPLIEDEYVCELDETTLAIAKKEIREDEHTRSEALAQFRKWLRSQDYMKNCRLDSTFLLRFLRTVKFSNPIAQENFLNYLTTRTTFPEWYCNLDSTDPPVKDLVSKGLIVPLLETDLDGRPIVMCISKVIDPKKHTPSDIVHALTISAEALLLDEIVQIRGGIYIIDLKDVGMDIVAMWTPMLMYKAISSGLKMFPGRHKEIHCINMGPITAALVRVALKACNKKIQQRVVIHDNAEDCLNKFPARILPKEYGGIIPIKEMSDKFSWLLEKQSKHFLQLDNMQLDSKWKENRAEEMFNEVLGCAGNFRKLELD